MFDRVKARNSDFRYRSRLRNRKQISAIIYQLSVNVPLAKERLSAYFVQSEVGVYTFIARAGGFAGSIVK